LAGSAAQVIRDRDEMGETMRKIRITLGLTLTALALSATPALAATFVSSGGETKAKSTTVQFWKLGPFKITCEKAVGSSGATTPLESETFFTSVHYRKCTTAAKLTNNEFGLKTKFLTPVAFEYDANGLYVEIGDEGEEEVEGSILVHAGTIEITIPALSREGEHCLIYIPYQRVPVKKVKIPYEEATFTNVPYGSTGKTRMEIVNSLAHVHFEFEGGQCEEFVKTEEELHGGTYEGSMLESISKGSIAFQP
jgi:hypothetical protein